MVWDCIALFDIAILFLIKMSEHLPGGKLRSNEHKANAKIEMNVMSE
jgi:hypothetical protein